MLAATRVRVNAQFSRNPAGYRVGMHERVIGERWAPSRTAVRFAAAGILAVLLVGAVLRFAGTGPLGVDLWWHGAAGATRGSGPFAVAVFFAEVGGGIGAAACTAIATALLLALRRAREAAFVMTAAVLGVALSEALKAFVLRPRPWDQFYPSHGSSFPSGHSMGAAVLAVSLVLVLAGSERISRAALRWAGIAATVWIGGMMWSRTALHVHWLTDAIAGALLGGCVAIIAGRIWFGTAERPRPLGAGGRA